ncbi:hypothetical protein OH77DRAFT_1525652 [Trametes cingulata]|nr:hypothetical protein OH77DRAFT_1525652 [Trametes cingulata]
MLRVKEHNERVRWFLREGMIGLACRCLIYGVQRKRPQIVLLSPREDFDPACGAPASSEDLDANEWFGGEPTISAINQYPGTSYWLRNGYDVIALDQEGRQDPAAESNITLWHLFGVEWVGNLVVVKRAIHDRSRAVHITSSEVSLVNVMVQQWLEHQLLEDDSGSDEDSIQEEGWLGEDM